MTPYTAKFPKLALAGVLAGVWAAASLTGCARSAISPAATELEPPDEWARAVAADALRENWLADFDDRALNRLVNEALINNYRLAEQAARVDEARQSAAIAGADRYPALSLSVNYTARQIVVDGERLPVTDGYDGGLNVAWEIDLWGKLSDAQKQASLLLAAREAEFREARLELAARVAGAWYQVVGARQLYDLFVQRRDNLEQNLEIIGLGYRRGIASAVDVYLTRSTVEQERARVAQQQQALDEAVSDLQLLLARYPDGRWAVVQELPTIDMLIPPGLPSELMTRRPDIQQAWYELLAADTALAVAHKQRFPSLTLVGGPSNASAELQDLLDGGSVAWTLTAGLAQPIFQGGRLRAAEEQARSRVVQAEKAYLGQVYGAFAEVENAISRHASLQGRYAAFLQVEQDSTAAYELSFEQYQRGLVSYATVLEAQRRAFDAQSTVIDLRNQLLQNRIGLYQALGGEFDSGAGDASGADS